MKTKQPLQLAKHHFAKELGVHKSAFDETNHVYQLSDKEFMMATFGNNVVFRGSESFLEWMEEEFDDILPERIMDGHHLYRIEEALRHKKRRLQGQHIYYVYTNHIVVPKVEGYTYQYYTRETIEQLYQFQGFDMALTYDVETDIAAYAAFDGDNCIAVAACDDRDPDIWQIGVDTDSEYRQQGLASYLVNYLARMLQSQGHIASYTTWGGNIASMNVAKKTGFQAVACYYYSKPINQE